MGIRILLALCCLISLAGLIDCVFYQPFQAEGMWASQAFENGEFRAEKAAVIRKMEAHYQEVRSRTKIAFFAVFAGLLLAFLANERRIRSLRIKPLPNGSGLT